MIGLIVGFVVVDDVVNRCRRVDGSRSGRCFAVLSSHSVCGAATVVFVAICLVADGIIILIVPSGRLGGRCGGVGKR